MIEIKQKLAERQKLIDKDNLKKDESVGTFRWNDDVKLLPAPTFRKEMRGLLKDLDQGWQGYVGPRFCETAVNETINVQPH